VTGPSFPDHLLTLAEWAELPEYEQFHVEVCEGVLSASPRPAYLHQHVAFGLVAQLADQLPKELAVLGDVEVLLTETPLTVRCPDGIVVDRALVDADPDRATGADVRLVVEVMAEGSVRTDRVTKFSEYAEARIPVYWMIDLVEPATLGVFVLDEGWYRYEGEYTGKVTLPVAGHRVSVDLDALTAVRPPQRSAPVDGAGRAPG